MKKNLIFLFLFTTSKIFSTNNFTIDLDEIQNHAKWPIILLMPLLLSKIADAVSTNDNIDSSDNKILQAFSVCLSCGTGITALERIIARDPGTIKLLLQKYFSHTATLFFLNSTRKTDLFDNFVNHVGQYFGIINANENFISAVALYILIYKSCMLLSDFVFKN